MRAIALHNLRHYDQTISFSKEPLAFLLALCDQLQEWRRPRLSYSAAPGWFLGRLAAGRPEPGDLDGPFLSMVLGLQASRDEQGALKFQLLPPTEDGYSLPISVEYSDEINDNNNVFGLWLDATLNYQRLNFAGLGFSVNAKFITPAFKGNQGRKEQQQFFRLRDAAFETHMDFLTNWFPTAKDGNFLKSDAVSYCCILDRNDKKQEHLELKVDRLAKRPLVTQDMDVFWKQLRQWKHCNDGRQFAGDYAEVVPE